MHVQLMFIVLLSSQETFSETEGTSEGMQSLEVSTVATKSSAVLGMLIAGLRNLRPPSRCPPNEVHKFCKIPCNTCNYRQCAVQTCEPTECDCIPHFYRAGPGEPCQPVALCPKPECGENEVFRPCGPLCETCSTIRCFFMQCDYRCYCKEGYLRNAFGKCVPEKECPIRRRCSIAEENRESGLVDEYCDFGSDRYISDEIQNVEQCYCKEGFKRSLFGFCMQEQNCNISTCIGVEKFYECVPQCNTTCRNYGDPDCVEDGQCYAGCFCPPGYAMNDHRLCVPVEECEEANKEWQTTAAPAEQSRTTSGGQDEIPTTAAAASESDDTTTDSNTFPTTEEGETDEEDESKDDEDESGYDEDESEYDEDESEYDEDESEYDEGESEDDDNDDDDDEEDNNE